MAKVDAYFTLHFWGDNDDLADVSEIELKTALAEMIDDIFGGHEDLINYKASLTNHLTGVTVEQSEED